MKRKLIERTEAKAPVVELERQVLTAQEVQGILILNIFCRGELEARYAMNIETYEYECVELKDGIWKQKKIGDLWTGRTYSCWNNYLRDRDVLFDTGRDRDLIMGLLKKENWRTDAMALIESRETEYGQDLRERKELRRKERVEETMAKIPDVPDDLPEWILDRVGRVHYQFFDRDTKEWACTCCRERTPEKELKRADGERARHGDPVICPHCGASATAMHRICRKEVFTNFCLIQPVDEEMGVARHFDVKVEWDKNGRYPCISEAVRILLFKPKSRKYKKYRCDLYYNQWPRDQSWGSAMLGGREDFDNRGNSANRRIKAGYLYDGGIQEALTGTAYEPWARLFAQMAVENKTVVNYNALMACYDSRMAGIAEMLYKGRFYRLLREESGYVQTWCGSYSGGLELRGNRIEEVFGIRDRQKINRIRDLDGGSRMLDWMQWSDETGEKIGQETLEWLEENKLKPKDVETVTDCMSLQQIRNYLVRQQAESYPKEKIEQVLEQWKDYLRMAKHLGKHMDDEMVFRPRELKRRHDEAVKELEEREAEVTANEYAERFPGVEEVMAEIREKYEYASDQYIITVPRRCMDIVVEGRMLHHCAGACDRYFDRIRQRETYICFLRRTEEPDKPYYTIEVEPGGTIRQHRGMYDEEPGIEEIRPFLREWQQVIKKRITEQDRHYARISAVKREENIKDLEAKNNTRVLQGLMEDFMEAI